VTVCHSKTTNLTEITKTADILIVACGKPKFIKSEHVKKGVTIVDVGINRTDEGLCGDVDFEDVKSKCYAITPVPGGVGPMTVYSLIENTLMNT
jgi:methylenetetrahydrofolate dehydrogenase (NADP+)/methenyltetrahydrofolate cyclohydrolase